MTEIEAGYVVHQNSTLKSTEEVDAKGMKIAAPEKAGYELLFNECFEKCVDCSDKKLCQFNSNIQ